MRFALFGASVALYQLHGQPHVREAGGNLLERILEVLARFRGIEVRRTVGIGRRCYSLEHRKLRRMIGKIEADNVELDAFVLHISG